MARINRAQMVQRRRQMLMARGIPADGYDKEKCAYCESQLIERHRDHLIPRSRGGSDHVENCVVSCAPCNLAKSNKTPSEWRPEGLPEWIYARERILSKKYKMPSRAPKSLDSLVGKFFHSFKLPDPNVHRSTWGNVLEQGRIESLISDGFYKVQLYSWLDGFPSACKIVGIDQMKGWELYDNAEAWIENGSRYLRQKR